MCLSHAHLAGTMATVAQLLTSLQAACRAGDPARAALAFERLQVSGPVQQGRMHTEGSVMGVCWGRYTTAG